MSTVNHRSDGRFAPGNRAAVGNPNNKRMFELRRALLDAIEPAAIEKAIHKIADLAAGGDVAAARLLLEYGCGKPVQGIEVSGLGSGTVPLTIAYVNDWRGNESVHW